MNNPAQASYALRPIGAGDLDIVLAWRNSDRVRRFMFSSHIISMEEHRAWFERVSASPSDRCLIFERNSKPLGLTSFSQIHLGHRRAFWGFYIGEILEERGVGSVLGRLSLNYAFDELRLHKVIGEVLPGNEPSLRLFRRLGFNEEGVLHDEIWRDGEPHDVVRFAMLCSQWREIRDEA